MSLEAEFFHLKRCKNALTSVGSQCSFSHTSSYCFNAAVFEFCKVLWQSYGCRRLGSTFALSCA
jgi:hypothetical protein